MPKLGLLVRRQLRDAVDPLWATWRIFSEDVENTNYSAVTYHMYVKFTYHIHIHIHNIHIIYIDIISYTDHHTVVCRQENDSWLAEQVRPGGEHTWYLSFSPQTRFLAQFFSRIFFLFLFVENLANPSKSVNLLGQIPDWLGEGCCSDLSVLRYKVDFLELCFSITSEFHETAWIPK